MKQNILPAIKLTVVCIIFFMIIYPLFIWGIAQAAPNKGKGETVFVNGKVVGYKLIGQKFTRDKYFGSRPSAVDYNAAGSGGSNKGPTNPDYLKAVADRIDTFLAHNPGLQKEKIPSELVTASGSGLDPDLSPAAAYIQVKRISKTRNITEQQLNDLIAKNIQQPLLGLLGTAHINVLQLNIQLDEIKK
jgi:K+-transporting ATPase ATPase C chain